MSLSLHAKSDVESFSSRVLDPYLSAQADDLAQLEQAVADTETLFAEEAGSRKQNLEQLQALKEQQAADARMESTRTSELEASVAELSLRAQTLLPNELSTLEKKVSQASQGKDLLAQQVLEVEKQHQRELAALSRGVGLFRRVLGVEFAAVKGQLHVRFAFIIPSAGDALTHSLALLVDAQKQYQVTSCSPPLECMARLVGELNANSNFAQFIARVRREFVRNEEKKQME